MWFWGGCLAANGDNGTPGTKGSQALGRYIAIGPRAPTRLTNCTGRKESQSEPPVVYCDGWVSHPGSGIRHKVPVWDLDASALEGSMSLGDVAWDLSSVIYRPALPSSDMETMVAKQSPTQEPPLAPVLRGGLMHTLAALSHRSAGTPRERKRYVGAAALGPMAYEGKILGWTVPSVILSARPMALATTSRAQNDQLASSSTLVRTVPRPPPLKPGYRGLGWMAVLGTLAEAVSHQIQVADGLDWFAWPVEHLDDGSIRVGQPRAELLRKDIEQQAEMWEWEELDPLKASALTHEHIVKETYRDQFPVLDMEGDDYFALRQTLVSGGHIPPLVPALPPGNFCAAIYQGPHALCQAAEHPAFADLLAAREGWGWILGGNSAGDVRCPVVLVYRHGQEMGSFFFHGGVLPTPQSGIVFRISSLLTNQIGGNQRIAYESKVQERMNAVGCELFQFVLQ